MSDQYDPAPLTVERSRSGSATVVVVLVALALLAGWFATHPQPLPTSSKALEATTPSGVPIYVGVFAPDPEGGRRVAVRGIDVDPVDDDLDLGVTGLVCRGGSIGVTSDPEAFCTELVDAEGASVGPGDELVVELVGDLAGRVELGRVRLSYRDGLQWGTDEVGPPIVATILTG